MSCFTISPNLLEIRGIDRNLRSRLNRDQGHGYLRLEHAPDGFRILEDICVVNLDRIPGAETKRRLFGQAANENDMMNPPGEFGVKHFEGREIRQRTERDVHHVAVLSQRFGQPPACRRFNAQVFPRSRARVYRWSFTAGPAAEPVHEFCCDRGRSLERSISIGGADAGNSQIGAPERQQKGERIIHFAERRSNGRIGVEPNRGCPGAGQGAPEEEEQNRDRESGKASAFALRN